MDFIERIFGISPDGGNGALEFLVVAGNVVAVAIAAYTRYRRRAAQKSLFPG